MSRGPISARSMEKSAAPERVPGFRKGTQFNAKKFVFHGHLFDETSVIEAALVQEASSALIA